MRGMKEVGIADNTVDFLDITGTESDSVYFLTLVIGNFIRKQPNFGRILLSLRDSMSGMCAKSLV